MGYQMMYRRPFGDREKPFMYVATDENGNVAAEPWDNGLENKVLFRSMEVWCKKEDDKNYKSAYKVSNEDFNLYLTESRLIFKYILPETDKKAKSSFMESLFRSIDSQLADGQNILGQIRYEWLMDIMYLEKTGWMSGNMLRFTYVDSDRAVWMVNIEVENDTDVKLLANDILHKACRYKEATKSRKNDELIRFLAKYKTAEITPVKGRNKFSVISFPAVMMACTGEDKRPDLT